MAALLWSKPLWSDGFLGFSFIKESINVVLQILLMKSVWTHLPVEHGCPACMGLFAGVRVGLSLLPVWMSLAVVVAAVVAAVAASALLLLLLLLLCCCCCSCCYLRNSHSRCPCVQMWNIYNLRQHFKVLLRIMFLLWPVNQAADANRFIFLSQCFISFETHTSFACFIVFKLMDVYLKLPDLLFYIF